jgi:hypothetical protein
MSDIGATLKKQRRQNEDADCQDLDYWTCHFVHNIQYKKNNWILRANALWMTTMSTHFFALLRVTETRVQDDEEKGDAANAA